MSFTSNSQNILALAGRLQPLPAILTRLSELANASACDLETVADAIRMDPVLTLKLLGAANSAFAASGTPVDTVDEAVMRLGTGLVVSMAFTLSVGGLISPALPPYGIENGALWRHSAAAAIAAEGLVRIGRNRIPAATVTAALLHDIGKQIMAAGVGAEEFDFIHEAQRLGTPLAEAESEVTELNHAEVGCLVAQHWGLPDRICRAIMYHHHPDQWDDPICDAVYLANLVAKVIEVDEDEVELPEIQDGVLERLELGRFDPERFCAQSRERWERLRALYGA
jgi:putative nucleotidyltransferase with HDIG domain